MDMRPLSHPVPAVAPEPSKWKLNSPFPLIIPLNRAVYPNPDESQPMYFPE